VGRRGGERAQPVLLPDGHVRHSTQQQRWLPKMLGGDTVGGYSLSEPQAGSDAAVLRCKAERVDGGYRVTGTKAWITHGGRCWSMRSAVVPTGRGPASAKIEHPCTSMQCSVVTGVDRCCLGCGLELRISSLVVRCTLPNP